MKGFLGIATLTLVLVSVARPADAFVRTHGMMLDSVATVVAADLLRGTASDRSVIVVVPIVGDTMGILAQRLVERLRADGREVLLHERPLPSALVNPPTLPPGMTPPSGDTVASSGPSSLELRARVDGAGVAYVRRIRSFPFGVKGYERLTTMRASATFVDPRSGEVFWARSASGSATDVVSKRDLAYVTSGSVGWNPTLPRGSGFRLLEPVIVLGVVAGLVVLFYSNRN